MNTDIHPTTECCLDALGWLNSRYAWENILDIGCGGGFLSLVAAGMAQAAGCKPRVLAADISPDAVEATQTLFTSHGMLECLAAIRSDGFSEPAIKAGAPYDLIICNLLAEPITQWAPLMRGHLAPGGVCVLSGILAWLAPPLLDAYAAQGFKVLHRIERGNWVTLVVHT